ncbi:glutathione binding-like protein [uncultured Sphingorhabdus sp.]|uniref:glutathione binding-like protein n=1 Tax=uncultured Sphingorhabdus sp. TaxID=1686106 RepID=UPI002632330B|nr:glutathione binding-like protein [uncultured Sphingorhabdus sp.]HMS21676.1 glutathione binding-like protein [Sphingorhabdus sp.]
MQLYFAPLSCSMATRITLYELGLEAEFHQVGLMNKQLVADGSDYLAINPKGQVPALRTDDGDILTEGPAILQYVADLDPDHRMAPAAGTIGRAKLHQWLNYIATEIHKAVFYFMFNPASPPEAKAFARDKLLPARYDFLSRHMEGRDYLLDQFSVADAYLATSLNWAAPAGVDLAQWPVLKAWHERILTRPAVARAFAEELALR